MIESENEAIFADMGVYGDIVIKDGARVTSGASGNGFAAVQSGHNAIHPAQGYGDITIDGATVTAKDVNAANGIAIEGDNITISNKSVITWGGSASQTILASGNLTLTDSSITASGDAVTAIASNEEVELGGGAVVKAPGTGSFAIKMSGATTRTANITGEVSVSGMIGESTAPITLKIAQTGTLQTVAGEPLYIADNSEIEIADGGTLRANDGGVLNIGQDSKISVATNGFLRANGGGELNIGQNSKLDVAGTLRIQENGKINIENGCEVKVDSSGAISNCGSIEATGIKLTNDGTVLSDADKFSGVDLASLSGEVGGSPCSVVTPPTDPPATDPPATEPPTTNPPAAPTPSPEPKKEKKDDRPAPIVPVLYGFTKSGDTFSFEVIAANANGNLTGSTVTVMLNGTYSAKVTIDADGVGRGTLEAPGFKGADAIFTAKIDGKGVSVAVPTRVYTNGKIVRR